MDSKSPAFRHTIRSWTLLATLAALSGYGAPGCSQDAQMLDDSDPCAEIDCSGHGQCAVTNTHTALCVCDTGWHSEDLACVENQPGEECSGVTCSGHGSCVVVQGDPAYPLCSCEEGYHTEADTNCVKDASSLTCGPDTHEEEGACVPDGARPDDFCVPEFLESPGRVVVGTHNDRIAGYLFLTWTGTEFLAFRLGGHQTGEDVHLRVRTIDLDGNAGPEQDLGVYNSAYAAVANGNRAAVLVEDSADITVPKHVLIVDDEANLVASVDVPGDTKHIAALKNGFCVWHGGSLTPINKDGDLGDEVVLVQDGVLGAVAYDPDRDRIGYSYVSKQDGQSDRLGFVVANASDYSVVSEDLLYDDLTDARVQATSKDMFYSDRRYLFWFAVSITWDNGWTDGGGVVQAFDEDGTELSAEEALGRSISTSVSRLVFPGRFAALIGQTDALHPGFWLLDPTGHLYPGGMANSPYTMTDSGTVGIMAGAGYSDQGIAFLEMWYDTNEVRMVFSRWECQ